MSKMPIDSDFEFVGRHGGIGGFAFRVKNNSSFHYPVRGLQRYNDPKNLSAISISLLRIPNRGRYLLLD